jgi:hypothetical protein
MRGLRQRMRRAIAITAALLAFALMSAQVRAFVDVPSTCCCGHRLPCKCPEHQRGHRSKSDKPGMRPCGQSGQLTVSPDLPECDLSPTIASVPPTAAESIALPLPTPRPAPVRAVPPVPI